MEIKLCNYCHQEFETNHGNTDYCSNDCYMDSKKYRQRKARDGIKKLLPILYRNHEILETLYNQSKREFTERELLLEGLDSSLCRLLYPDAENRSLIRLDFGAYFLETSDNFITIKLYSNETSSV